MKRKNLIKSIKGIIALTNLINKHFDEHDTLTKDQFLNMGEKLGLHKIEE